MRDKNIFQTGKLGGNQVKEVARVQDQPFMPGPMNQCLPAFASPDDIRSAVWPPSYPAQKQVSTCP